MSLTETLRTALYRDDSNLTNYIISNCNTLYKANWESEKNAVSWKNIKIRLTGKCILDLYRDTYIEKTISLEMRMSGCASVVDTLSTGNSVDSLLLGVYMYVLGNFRQKISLYLARDDLYCTSPTSRCNVIRCETTSS